ncbi:hypothetical protein ACHAW6_015359 [Cyclotella cf. meneghiniana]
MSSSQSTPQQSSAKSELSSQDDKCGDKSLAKLAPDAEVLPKQIPLIERLFLRKISKMIANEKWRALELVLWSYSNDIKSCDYVSDVGDTGDDDEVSFLHIVHYACQFNPPQSIVRLLASMYSTGITTPDKTGRLPLHYAAKCGASPRLIKCLIKMDPSAVSTKDSEGKTPIHHLCLHYVDAFHPNNFSGDINVEDCMLQAICALVEVDPSIVAVEDNLDVTALEYAIESNAPYRVVRRLQMATGKFWKEREKTTASEQNTRLVNDNNHDVDNFPDHHRCELGYGQRQIEELNTSFSHINSSSTSDAEEKSHDLINTTVEVPGQKSSNA